MSLPAQANPKVSSTPAFLATRIFPLSGSGYFALPHTLSFPRDLKLSSLSPRCLHSSTFPFSPSQPSDDTEVDGQVLGDCVVFEEGVFDDPNLNVWEDLGFRGPDGGTPRKKAAEVQPENLVPEQWREAQAELNLTKKERRRIAREMEFGTKLERRRRGLAPARSVNLEEYATYREAKLAQLKPLVLENPTDFPDPKPSSDQEESSSSSERVEPRNPRLAVYGKGLEDVTDFFNSVEYVPGQNNSEGRRKLFTKEEKTQLNRKTPDLAAATSEKWLPVHTLAASGEYNLLFTLLKHNVDINSVDKVGWTALHRAIIGKKQAVTNYLLRESANPFVRDRDGATLMHYAVQTASSQAIKVLLLYNVDINLQDYDGWTPLHLAVQARRTDVVKLLLIKGANKTLKNRDGLTPLGLCLYSGRDTRTYELIKLLKQPPKMYRQP